MPIAIGTSVLLSRAGANGRDAGLWLDRAFAAYERAQVELNAVAVHDLTLAVLPQMVERNSGAILMVGSAAGNMPIPNNATYAATKAFVNTFSESLRGELKGTGVHVTLLAPGPVRTEEPDPAEASIVDKLVPDFLWISSEHTAKVSLDALAANRMRIVPGVIMALAFFIAALFVPRVRELAGLPVKTTTPAEAAVQSGSTGSSAGGKTQLLTSDGKAASARSGVSGSGVGGSGAPGRDLTDGGPAWLAAGVDTQVVGA